MTTPQDDATPAIRIGRTERDAALRALDEHLSAGRLDADEYGERAARAALARHQADLDALFTDLPEPRPRPVVPPPTWAAPPVQPHDPVPARRAWSGGAGAVVATAVCVGLGFAFNLWWAFALWWVIAAVAGGAVPGRRRGRRY